MGLRVLLKGMVHMKEVSRSPKQGDVRGKTGHLAATTTKCTSDNRGTLRASEFLLELE